MRAGAFARALLRESRGSAGRLVFFIACLAIGVAAVVGVSALVASIEDGIHAQSRELLAADLSVRSRRKLPEEEIAAFFAALPGAETTAVRELATMVAATDPSGEVSGSTLAELKVVGGTYPFYGSLELEPPGTLAEALDAHSAVVAPELCAALSVDVGDTLRIGGQPFRIAAIVNDEPDRLDFSLTLGPRVFLSAAGLARAPLLGFGSRVRYRALVRLPGDPSKAELDAVRDRLDAALGHAEHVRIETHRDARPSVRRALERAEDYLGLVALLSLVLGGIGVAQIVRAWLAGRWQSIAVLRCLGMRPREVLALYLGHTLLLALVGSLVGAALGAALPAIAAAAGLVPDEARLALQPLAIARGLLLGVAVATLFSLPPLVAVWRVPPARVLRSDAEPLSAPLGVRVAAWAALALGLWGSAWAQAGSLGIASAFAGGLVVLVALFALAARALSALAGRVPADRVGPYLRSGLGALARPGAGTTGAIVALALGVLVVTSMALVERRLSSELDSALPSSAPTAFFVDVQPSQWEGVRATLEGEGARHVQSVPVVTARLAAIDGVPVAELVRYDDDHDDDHDDGDGDGRGRSNWRLTREQRLTWMDALPEDNVIVEGALWSDPERAEVSIEEEFAAELGVGVGSELRFDVQGRPIEVVVTSLRTVEWESFGINFFLVVEPGVLDGAPSYRVATAQLDEEAEQRVQNRIAASFPNVTMVRIRPLLERIVALLERIAIGVRILGWFTVATGVAILAGSIASTNLRRAREAALLKTLGVTRRGVVGIFATEYALSGLVAGTVGGAGALLLAWAFLRHVLELAPELPLVALPLAAALSALLATVFGIAASARALAARPLASLRG